MLDVGNSCSAPHNGHLRPNSQLCPNQVLTSASGQETDDIKRAMRATNFKGWSKANYQLAAHSYIPIGDKEFLTSMSYVYDSPREIEQWINSETAPPAHYYFESRTVKAGHKISAVTTLTFIYDSSQSESGHDPY